MFCRGIRKFKASVTHKGALLYGKDAHAWQIEGQSSILRLASYFVAHWLLEYTLEIPVEVEKERQIVLELCTLG